MASQQDKRKAAAQTGFYLIVIAAIAAMANILSAGAYKRLDWTKAERHTLSQGSGRLLRGMKSTVQVDAYVTHGLAQMDAFIRELTDLLKEYERASGGKFQYTIIEPKTDELRERAKEAGLEELQMGEQSATDDAASITQGYMGLVFKYGSEKGVIPVLNPGQTAGLEFWITNKIREIRDKADDIKHKVGVVTGKDELKLSDQNLLPKQGQGGASIDSIIKRAFPFYETVDVDLKDGETEIDRTLDGLIVTQPQKPYSDKELRRIDQFLMLGNKSLAVFASAVTMKAAEPAMTATLDLHNLDKLLVGYGINMKKNVVLDYGAQFQMPVLTQLGVGQIRNPAIIHLIDDPTLEGDEKMLDTSFPAFFRLPETVFPFASSLEIQRDKQPSDVKITAIARSSDQAGSSTEGTVDLKIKMDWPPKPPYDRHVLAATAEGKLKSAFAGGGDDLGVKVPERAPQPSRVLVVSSSEFLTNPFAYSGNGPDLGPQFAMYGGAPGDKQLLMFSGQYANRYLTNTILAVKNTLDWISGDQDLLAASAKIISEPNLTYRDVAKPKIKAEDDQAAINKKNEEYRTERKRIQSRVQLSLSVGLPLFFAFFGLFRWRERQGKKDKYRL